MELLITTLGLAVGLNLLIFIPAYLLKTDKLTDITYALSFVIIAVWSAFHNGVTTSEILLIGMILLWALRLGGYLLIRIRKMGKDKRFDAMREKPLRFAGFWLLQGVSVWTVLLPSTFFFDRNPKTLPAFAFVGLSVWATGLLIETVADLQKYRFINSPRNKGKWIDRGLWKYSRHPNYFGEMTVWTGIYLFTLFSLPAAQAIIGIIGPLYIISLILFVSGVPLLEKAADKRWGAQKAYQAYKRETSVLIPLPKRASK